MADPAAPYPSELERHARLPDGTPVFLRPIRPGDWQLLQWGFRRLSQEDIHFRFHGGMARLTDAVARRLATVDYRDEIAFLALSQERPRRRGLGIVRLARSDAETAEIALILLPAWKRRGLGRLLSETALDWARAQGFRRVIALLQQDNLGMRRLASSLGFTLAPMPEEPGLLRAEKVLSPSPLAGEGGGAAAG
jgi:GNAT superfamily N-acetyltransferase